MSQAKLLAIGEAHLAFVPDEPVDSLKTSKKFIKEAGGSAITVAVNVAQSGNSVEFIGKLGKDPFGDYITGLLHDYGVGTSYLLQTHLAPTRVIFRSHAQTGDRFLPQTTSADGLLRPDDINKDWIDRGDIIYFSSTSLTQNSGRGAIEKAMHCAGEKGAMITFAPQLDLDEWPNETLARETILHSIPYAHILIISEEELHLFSEKEDEFLAIKKLFGGKTKCMIILRGNNGITYVTERDKGNIRFNIEDVVDQTGMDDAFIGYFLSDLLQRQITVNQFSDYLIDTFNLEGILESALKYRNINGQQRGVLPRLAGAPM